MTQTIAAGPIRAPGRRALHATLLAYAYPVNEQAMKLVVELSKPGRADEGSNATDQSTCHPCLATRSEINGSC